MRILHTHQILRKSQGVKKDNSVGCQRILTNKIVRTKFVCLMYPFSPANGVPNDGTFEVEFSQKLDGTSDVSLVVKRALDRETRDRYDLVLSAVDGGTDPSPREGSMAVNVIVEDDNDHTPVFDQDK